jgi:hypothetical protein
LTPEPKFSNVGSWQSFSGWGGGDLHPATLKGDKIHVKTGISVTSMSPLERMKGKQFAPHFFQSRVKLCHSHVFIRAGLSAMETRKNMAQEI